MYSAITFSVDSERSRLMRSESKAMMKKSFLQTERFLRAMGVGNLMIEFKDGRNVWGRVPFIVVSSLK